ncbi:hypothetical protein SCP_1301050 [Sparassis crispa]|uniref:F-box domain-containing protein n=1 Tax=Sparassis crispa TaxID=139825 RepID=A0A401H1P9_9APHY|nr:hypothetical protein SCP_1301050 [Sparassis crispa]GBE88290.1 hypothetical protein SCP_1301050 [Sparassis crispa]
MLFIDSPEQHVRQPVEADQAHECRAVFQALSVSRSKLELQKMPAEILDAIIKLVGAESARRLCSLCRAFRQISFPYIHTSRKLTILRIPNLHSLDWHLMRSNEIIKHLTIARQKFMENMMFITRPDVILRIRRLELATANDVCYRGLLKLAQVRDVDTVFSVYCRPVVQGINNLLAGARHLTTLCFTRIEISSAIVAVMADMPALYTLEILYCDYKLPSADGDSDKVPSVRNLTLRGKPNERTLHPLAFLPNVLVLVLAGEPLYSPICLPSDSFRECYNPFSTLERIIIQFPEHDETLRIYDWMCDAIRKFDGLRLTHFKALMQSPLDYLDTEKFVFALQFAPLRTLVLDGLWHIPEDLFIELADCPQLEQLTLTYAHYNDTSRAATVWPEPMSQYAEWLAYLPALRDFAWNYLVDPLARSGTREYWNEVGYPVVPDGRLPDLRFRDWSVLARIFVAYCPDLHSLEFLSERTAILAFTMGPGRDVDGRVTVVSHDLPWNGSKRQEEMNPNDDVVNTKNAWVVGLDE